MDRDFIYPPWECCYKLGEEIPSSIGYKTIDLPGIVDIERTICLKEKLIHIKKYMLPILFTDYSYRHLMMAIDIMGGGGELIEKYFCYQFKKIDPRLEQGDRRDHIENKNFQFKASILTQKKRDANINHIQAWHNVDEYRIVIIDRSNNYRPYFFILTKEQMLKELVLCNAISTDGTKIANKHNRRKYLKIILPCKNNIPAFQRWTTQYGCLYWRGAFNNIFSTLK